MRKKIIQTLVVLSVSMLLLSLFTANAMVSRETLEDVDEIVYVRPSDAGASWATVFTPFDISDCTSRNFELHSSECMIRPLTMDSMGHCDEDINDSSFSIMDTPPAPPENLQVEHYGGVKEPGETGDYNTNLWTTSFVGPYGDTTPVDIYYPTDNTEAPYPAIVLGHGFTMDKSYFETWGEYYASWGYVTAVPSLQYASMFGSDHEKCAYELLATIDFVKEKNNDGDSPIEGMVDDDRIALTGFSLGAKAAVLAVQYEVQQGEDNVKALAPMAVAIENDPDPLPGLHLIDIPVQLQAGENDEIAPPEDNSQPVYDGLEGSPTQYFMIEGANHNQYADRDPMSGGIGDGEATISREEQHIIARKYSTSFFNFYLKNEKAYGEYLYGEYADQDLEDEVTVFNQYKYIDYEKPEGTDHNLVTWDASLDDPSDVSHYNVYRSETSEGGYELISSVDADGSVDYRYIDWNKGTADDVWWWYIVRAVGTNGLEEENEDAVQEPGDTLVTFDIPLYAGGDAGGWNFVSFNLVPPDSSLETILEDPDYGISASYDSVMYFDASADSWYTYVPGRPAQFNNLENWDHSMGVWIRMTVDDTLTIEGSEPTQTTITLQPGWNMVGLPSSTGGNHNLPTEVSRIGYFDSAQEYNLAYGHDPANFEFVPGEGHWLYNDADYEVDWLVDY